MTRDQALDLAADAFLAACDAMDARDEIESAAHSRAA